MPQHEPDPPYTRFRPNPAATVLGVGTHAGSWTVSGIIEMLTQKYGQLMAMADECQQRNETRLRRLYMARALEHASLLALYYQERGNPPMFTRWDRRARQCSHVAYRGVTNKAAPDLGAAAAPPTLEDV